MHLPVKLFAFCIILVFAVFRRNLLQLLLTTYCYRKSPERNSLEGNHFQLRLLSYYALNKMEFPFPRWYEILFIGSTTMNSVQSIVN